MKIQSTMMRGYEICPSDSVKSDRPYRNSPVRARFASIDKKLDPQNSNLP